MTASERNLRLGLEDLLGDLIHARRTGDLGRVALIVYCDLRRWARQADRQALANHANMLFLDAPYMDRVRFLANVDALIDEAQQALASMADIPPTSGPAPAPPAGSPSPGLTRR